MRNYLTEIESKEYFKYLLDHTTSLTGYDSDLSKKVRDIIYGVDKDPAKNLVNIVRTSGALKPSEWLREKNINLILE